MSRQEETVDYWAMLKAMMTYGALTALGWMMMRVYTFPSRLRAQQNRIQATLEEMQRRYPDLNITEEELKDAEKECDQILNDEKQKSIKKGENTSVKKSTEDESKKQFRTEHSL